jgi:hypothetical protein
MRGEVELSGVRPARMRSGKGASGHAQVRSRVLQDTVGREEKGSVTRKKHDWDRQATAEARFQDSRSYVKHDGHQYLFGDDVTQRRSEIYERDKGMCQLRISKRCIAYPGWHGHLHHVEGGNTDDRCWCRTIYSGSAGTAMPRFIRTL